MAWAFQPAVGGTEVTVHCMDVPRGIRQDDHLAGVTASLANLAAFIEGSG